MQAAKYTNEEHFQCLEDLPEDSTELSLIHMGREACAPSHVYVGARDEFIIHFVLSGRGFYSANGNTWNLCGGQMFLVYPHETVVYCADNTEPWAYCWVGIKGFKAEALLKKCGFTRTRRIASAPESGVIAECFDQLFKHTTLNDFDCLYRQSLLLKLLAVLCSWQANSPTSSDVQKRARIGNTYVERAIDFINTAYMQGVTVSDVAGHIGISRAHLNRVFQEEMGLSVQAFLTDFRLHKAASILIDTDLAVKAVSQCVGYGDPLVFSKAFKKKMGLSPRAYRSHRTELEIREKRP